jgi:hypothetical protein
MVVLAIIIFAPSSWINQIQTSNIQKCNSFTGQLSQTLSGEDAAPSYIAASQTGLVISAVLGVLGVVLIVVGTVKNPGTPNVKESQPQMKMEQFVPTPTTQGPINKNCKVCAHAIRWPSQVCSQLVGRNTDVTEIFVDPTNSLGLNHTNRP